MRAREKNTFETSFCVVPPGRDIRPPAPRPPPGRRNFRIAVALIIIDMFMSAVECRRTCSHVADGGGNADLADLSAGQVEPDRAGLGRQHEHDQRYGLTLARLRRYSWSTPTAPTVTWYITISQTRSGESALST